MSENLAEGTYIFILYASGYYDHRALERIPSVFEAFCTSSVDRLIEDGAEKVLEHSCHEYAIIIDGVVAYDSIGGNGGIVLLGGTKPAPARYVEEGNQLAERIHKEYMSVLAKQKAEEERRAKEDAARLKALCEQRERKLLEELILKYGEVKP